MSAYMKIEGLDGNVTAKGLEKTIEVISANFSVKRNMTSKPGAVMDREGTKPAVSEFTVTKEVDSTSPKLFGNATVGTLIPSVTVSFVNTGKDLSEYHSVIMKNVLVSGYELVHDAQSADGTNAKPMERVSFNYTNIEVKNTPHSKDHKASSPVAVGYNLETAQAA
ncbi:MAG: type VI secretion system tube protein Hcp [Gammaproteobacteria bacterium]|nr:type VI secretion system tube protein Hcp [Gammaproteobacteria bacterium]